jgi:hypothetical protein
MSDLNKDTLRPISMADSEKTATQSVEPSVFDTKEPQSSMPSNTPSVRDDKSAEPEANAALSKEINETTKETQETTAEQSSQKSASNEDDDDDFEYPKAWKLAIITLALCLSVFCMALV